MRIGTHEIGSGHPVFVVAELSGNHLRNYARTLELVHSAHAAGADAVKTQCFTASSMTLNIDAPSHRLTWAGKDTPLYWLYEETAMPMAWHEPLKAQCDNLGMEYFASVFSPPDCDFMDALGVPCHKIASFELTDLPLIRHVASKGKPVILSTGMATDMERVAALSAATANQAVFLHCTSAYPASIMDANVLTVWDLCVGYTIPIGLSDHTRNNAVVCAAVALGACMVERHLTLSRADGGPDAAFSDEPAEFAAMVQAVRDTTAALGTVRYGPTESEKPMLHFRRSLWVMADIAKGETFTAANVASLRPEGGLPPAKLPEVLGTVAVRAYKLGEPLAL